MKFMSKLVLASVAVVAFATQASAGMSVINGVNLIAIPNNNNYKSDLLNDAGLTDLYDGGADVIANSDGYITFAYHGAESGFTDQFQLGTASVVSGGAYTEGGGSFGAKDPWNSVGVVFAKIKILAGETFSSLGIGFTTLVPVIPGNNGIAGTAGFGVFAPNPVNTNVLYFGFDDDATQIDDNHDDMMVSAHFEAVPEPASMAVWGLGLVGAMVARRRRQNKLTA